MLLRSLLFPPSPTPRQRPWAATSERARRVLLFAIIFAAHLLIIIWLLTRISEPHVPVPNEGLLVGITMTSEGAGRSSEKKPVVRPHVSSPKPLPAPIIVIPSALAEHVSESMTSEPAMPPGGSGCQLQAQVETAIKMDAEAMTELAALPLGVRSEADAVMVWNGAWQNADPLAALSQDSASPLRSLREVIERTIAAAPQECRGATVTGPVLLPIPNGQKTTMLAVGSGLWRWSDLNVEPAVCGEGKGDSCPTTSKTP